MAHPTLAPRSPLGRVLEKARDLAEQVREAAERVRQKAEEARQLTEIARRQSEKGRVLAGASRKEAQAVKDFIGQSLDTINDADRRLSPSS